MDMDMMDLRKERAVESERAGPMLDLKKFGRQIKKYRIRRDMRQRDLADVTGLSLNTVSRLEQGIIGCSIDNLLLLSDALKVSPDALLFGNFKPEYSAFFHYYAEMKDSIKEAIGRGVDMSLAELFRRTEKQAGTYVYDYHARVAERGDAEYLPGRQRIRHALEREGQD